MADHKKIGIMGGTFNPIHFGHLLLAETAFHQFQLDEILIMPTKNPYYKKISNSVTEEDRVAMAELAIEDNGRFRLSKEELNREGNTYTVETLSHLTERHPNLTQGEKHLASLLRVNLSTKEIAMLTGNTPKTINMNRYRLRKALGLSSEEDLIAYIQSI